MIGDQHTRVVRLLSLPSSARCEDEEMEKWQASLQQSCSVLSLCNCVSLLTSISTLSQYTSTTDILLTILLLLQLWNHTWQSHDLDLWPFVFSVSACRVTTMSTPSLVLIAQAAFLLECGQTDKTNIQTQSCNWSPCSLARHVTEFCICLYTVVFWSYSRPAGNLQRKCWGVVECRFYSRIPFLLPSRQCHSTDER